MVILKEAIWAAIASFLRNTFAYIIHCHEVGYNMHQCCGVPVYTATVSTSYSVCNTVYSDYIADRTQCSVITQNPQ
jgi:hypothetical protein